MTDEHKEYDEEEKESKEDKEKSEVSIESSISALTETIKGFDAGLREEIKNISDKFDDLDSRVKAMEEPTDLPAKPKVQAEDDIGAKIKTPDTYQSNSQQAGIKESDEENERESDKNGLSMQEKSGVQELTKSEQVFTTETPRPGAAVENVAKSYGVEPSPVLKAARELGFEDLSNLGKRILKGEFGSPGVDSQW
jgi:hypothetical protein